MSLFAKFGETSMKKKQFESLCKKIIPDLPGFACRGWLMFARPVNHLLRGFCCEGSSFNPSNFTVTVFILPLYVPTMHLHFNFGKRLKDEGGCDQWWDIHDPNVTNALNSSIHREGLPFLQGVQQPSELVALVEHLPGNSNPHSLEAVAYSLAIAGDVAAAQEALERLKKALDVSIAWQSQMFERADQLGRLLRSDPSQAKRQLSEWEQVTSTNLGVLTNL